MKNPAAISDDILLNGTKMDMKNKTYKESENFIMSENMKKFLELVSKDENLKKKLEELDDTVYEQASQAGIALAKEFGIELSEADFGRKKSDGELSDDELDAVAGGARLAKSDEPDSIWNDDCICACVTSGGGGPGYCIFSGR